MKVWPNGTELDDSCPMRTSLMPRAIVPGTWEVPLNAVAVSVIGVPPRMVLSGAGVNVTRDAKGGVTGTVTVADIPPHMAVTWIPVPTSLDCGMTVVVAPVVPLNRPPGLLLHVTVALGTTCLAESVQVAVSTSVWT